VGNVDAVEANKVKNPVHPHVCGERDLCQIGLNSVTGSSPRVWGTSQMEANPLSVERFIPTCVGNVFDDRESG